MADMTLEDLSQKMREIDFAMLSTRTKGGAIASRPMSNNGQVAYRGDSFFFATEEVNAVPEIEADPNVGLSFTGAREVVDGRPFFVAVEGKAELIRDKSAFAEHWTKELDRWFDKGVDTPGLVMIRVHAERIHYWDGMDDGEVKL